PAIDRARAAGTARGGCTSARGREPRPRPSGPVVAVLSFWLTIAACRFPLLLAVALGAIAASPLVSAFVPAACRVGPGGASRRGLLLTGERAWPDVRPTRSRPAGGPRRPARGPP